MCHQKTQLFTVLLLENHHRMALYCLVLQFKRCLQSRASLLSSAMAMVSNSCTADKNIMITGCVAMTSLSEHISKV